LLDKKTKEFEKLKSDNNKLINESQELKTLIENNDILQNDFKSIILQLENTKKTL